MTKEEVQIVFGANADEVMRVVDKSTGYIEQWQQKVENMQRGYTGWWGNELKKREEMEIASATKAAAARVEIAKAAEATNLATAKKSLLEREAMIATQMAAAESAAANNTPERAGIRLNRAKSIEAEIAAGSGMFGSIEARAAKEAGEGLKEVGKHGKGLTQVFTELQVIMHETISGRWKQALSSFTRLLGFMGMGASMLPIVGTGVAGIIANLHMRKELAGMTGYTKENRETDQMQRNDLNKYIDQLVKYGKLGKDEALELQKEPVALAQKKLLRKFGGGLSVDDLKHQQQEEKNAARFRFESWESLRKEGDLKSRIATASLQEFILRKEMAKLAPYSAEWTQKAIEAEKIHRDYLSLSAQEAAKKAEAIKKERDFAAEVNKMNADAALEIKKVKQHEAEGYMPTLQELAGRGIFRSQARHALRDERLAKRAYQYGHVGQAESLIGDRNHIYDNLHARGVAPERSAIREMADINARLAIRLKEMGTIKSPMYVKPALK